MLKQIALAIFLDDLEARSTALVEAYPRLDLFKKAAKSIQSARLEIARTVVTINNEALPAEVRVLGINCLEGLMKGLMGVDKAFAVIERTAPSLRFI
jgi:hypothetical protein